MIKKYIPSSEEETKWFMENFCYHCKSEKFMHYQNGDFEEDGCSQFKGKRMFHTNTPSYPEVWIREQNGNVKCMIYEYYDWTVNKQITAGTIIEISNSKKL